MLAGMAKPEIRHTGKLAMSGTYLPLGAASTNLTGPGPPVDQSRTYPLAAPPRADHKRYPLDGAHSKTMEGKRTSWPCGRWLGLLAIAMFSMMSASCGGGAGPAAKEPAAALHPWTGALKALFDDSIHPAAVGMSLDGQPPEEDPLLRSRARAADVVARMRVNTVTVDTVGAKATYHLNLQVGQPTLLPTELEERSFELAVRTESPAHGIVSSLDSGLQGRTFIGFVRRFAGPQGPEAHFHLTADSAEVARVVAQTSMLDEMAKE